MRVAVISEVELGSPRAHFINVIKTGGGFVRLGCETTVFCRPAADGAPAEAIARSMGEPDLRWSLAPAGLDVDAVAAWATEQAGRMGADLAYCRSFRAPIACASAGLTTAMETHAYIGDTNPDLCAALDATARPTNPIAALITISHRLAEHYVARGAAASRVHVVPDGVDVELFRRPAGAIPETPMSRWPGARVLYSGHLYDAKGIPTVIEAAGLIDGVTVHLLGGLDEEVPRGRAGADGRGPGRRAGQAGADRERAAGVGDVGIGLGALDLHVSGEVLGAKRDREDPRGGRADLVRVHYRRGRLDPRHDLESPGLKAGPLFQALYDSGNMVDVRRGLHLAHRHAERMRSHDRLQVALHEPRVPGVHPGYHQWARLRQPGQRRCSHPPGVQLLLWGHRVFQVRYVGVGRKAQRLFAHV